MPALIGIRVGLRVRTFHGSAFLGRSLGVCGSAGWSVGWSIAFLLLVLCPHLLSTQLVVVHRTSAMRPLHSLLLVGVHLSGIDIVVVVGIRVRIVVLLVACQAIVRRLPAGQRVRNVRAVVAAVGLLAIVRRWLQDLRRVVSGRRVGGERWSLLLPSGWHWVLSRRLRSWRRLHSRSKMWRYSGHSSVHGVHVVVLCWSLKRRRSVDTICW